MGTITVPDGMEQIATLIISLVTFIWTWIQSRQHTQTKEQLAQLGQTTPPGFFKRIYEATKAPQNPPLK